MRQKIYNLLSTRTNTNYGYYTGSTNVWNVLLWNLIFPGRILSRIKGGTFFKKKFIKELYSYKNEDELNFWKKKYYELSGNGCVIIRNYFSEEDINDILTNYKHDLIDIENQLEDKETKSASKILTLNGNLLKFLLNKNLIALMKNFSSNELYLRNYPIIVSHKNWDYNLSTQERVKKNYKSKFADDWHVDHSNLFNVHILLEDLNENDLCMQFIPNSNSIYNQTSLFSDEEVRKLNKPVNCVGKKGTVYIHYGNTIHRMFPKKNSKRTQFHFEFSSKTNILLNYNKIIQCLSKGFSLDKLKLSEREILKGLFPITQNKGYDVNKNNSFKVSKNVI